MMAVRDGQPPQEVHRVAGLGWEARLYPDNEIELIVSPHEDVLPAALASLFASHGMRYWSYVWDHQDDLGRDVYLLHRGMLV
jgi:hypothetical protein